MNPLIQSKNATILPLLIALTLGCFGLSPQMRAVCQEGCDLNLFNTFLGDNALLINTTGTGNTAIGSNTLFSNTTSNYNTAIGDAALYGNTTGVENTAIGAFALNFNTDGFYNTATGWGALTRNTTGSSNTANGYSVLYFNTTGNYNTAAGQYALNFNTTGTSNTANGYLALFSNTTGNANTALGNGALAGNTTGQSNIALGTGAGASLTTGSDNIYIGNVGVAVESSTIRIGRRGTHRNTSIAGISGVTVPTGVAVIVDANGHLGTTTSSARFKEAIKPMDKASEAILALKPVTFRYKTALDPKGIPQFGLVAEQVEKVNPDLVARDGEGKPYTVRYEAVNAMLLNEFLKEHRKVEEQTVINQRQEATIAQQQQDFHAAIAQQQKEIQALTSALKAQAAQIQKVSDQLKARAPAPRVVAND